MPKKVTKTSSRKKAVISNNFLSRIKWDDSYVSLSVGLIVVVVIAVLGVVFFKGNRAAQDTSSTQFKPSIEFNQSQENETVQTVKAGSTYTVKAGDSLWSISEKAYKSGYNWVDIAKANNLTNPGNIFAGNKLTIPNVKPREITVTQAPTKIATIAGNTYTIQKGDDLWNISVRAYGDGYSWIKIAKANNLTNPDLIFSGNVLKIPR